MCPRVSIIAFHLAHELHHSIAFDLRRPRAPSQRRALRSVAPHTTHHRPVLIACNIGRGARVYSEGGVGRGGGALIGVRMCIRSGDWGGGGGYLYSTLAVRPLWPDRNLYLLPQRHPLNRLLPSAYDATGAKLERRKTRQVRYGRNGSVACGENPPKIGSSAQRDTWNANGLCDLRLGSHVVSKVLPL